jgi:hypothetical protein
MELNIGIETGSGIWGGHAYLAYMNKSVYHMQLIVSQKVLPLIKQRIYV